MRACVVCLTTMMLVGMPSQKTGSFLVCGREYSGSTEDEYEYERTQPENCGFLHDPQSASIGTRFRGLCSLSFAQTIVFVSFLVFPKIIE